MKTAMMSMSRPTLGSSPPGSGSAAVESAIDAYATRVLQAASPPEAFMDTSLGPYVTSVLRCAELESEDQVTSLGEFESLLELLEDQCNMSQEAASSALQTIARAVVTGVVPQDSLASSPNTNTSAGSGLHDPNGGLGGLYSLGGVEASLDSFQTMQAALPTSQMGIQRLDQLSIDPYTPNPAGGPSPLKPDNLIPVDLLGVLDDPPQNQQEYQQYPGQVQHPQTPQPMGTIAAAFTVEEHKMAQENQEAFPPLGAAADFPPLGASSKKSRKSKSHGKSKNQSNGNADKELAAALFRPSRPRQNSIENEEAASSPAQTSMVYPSSSHGLAGSSTGLDHAYPQQQQAQHNQYFQQQLDSSVEILLSMNAELSEEAASEAGFMAQADFNVAQYVVDAALSAPPVCRHKLVGGWCYRSDCQFSHDVEGHTCLFWLRGRCSKAEACKFLHGFHPKLMEGISSSASASSSNGGLSSVPVPIAGAAGGGYDRTSSYGNGYDASGSAGGFGGYSLPSASFMQPQASHQTSVNNSQPLSSSWQSPSLMEAMASANSSVRNPTPPGSFANIASRGYDKHNFSSPSSGMESSGLLGSSGVSSSSSTVRIPQDLWNPHENRDSSLFYIADPLERYRQVQQTQQHHSKQNARQDVMDLHFQSTKTYGVVLEQLLPSKLASCPEGVWIVTGTGHHVSTNTHQKGGGALERVVMDWLQEEGYSFAKGKDRNGLGGALLVKPH